jgi:uncharacterized protein YcbX
MGRNETVGSVFELWRFPVKSMRGERLEQAEVTEKGILGDRAYALIDTETGKVVSAKSVRLFPKVLDCAVSFVESPRAGEEIPPVQITLPDGSSCISDSDHAADVLSDFFKRKVRLAHAAPEDFTIDMYHPDLGELHPQGARDITKDQKLGSAYFADAGIPSPVPVGAFFDLFPVSVLTTSTLKRFSELEPMSRFDQRRFRMNVMINTGEEGFVENGWVGSELTIGNAACVKIAVPDSRCVMTTLAQADLPGDPNILKAIARHNRIQVANGGRSPCVGVYAVVTASGTIRTGDDVSIKA